MSGTTAIEALHFYIESTPFFVILFYNSRYKNILKNQKIVVILESKSIYLVLKKKRKHTFHEYLLCSRFSKPKL